MKIVLALGITLGMDSAFAQGVSSIMSDNVGKTIVAICLGLAIVVVVLLLLRGPKEDRAPDTLQQPYEGGG